MAAGKSDRTRTRVGRKKYGRLTQKQAHEISRIIYKIKDASGQFQARAIVRSARTKSSLIHDLFDWNNRVAGDRWREEQARSYIRSVTVEWLDFPSGEIASMPIAVSLGRNQGYFETESVMSSAKLSKRLESQALAEAVSWAERYKFIKRMVKICRAIYATDKKVRG